MVAEGAVYARQSASIRRQSARSSSIPAATYSVAYWASANKACSCAHSRTVSTAAEFRHMAISSAVSVAVNCISSSNMRSTAAQMETVPFAIPTNKAQRRAMSSNAAVQHAKASPARLGVIRPAGMTAGAILTDCSTLDSCATRSRHCEPWAVPPLCSTTTLAIRRVSPDVTTCVVSMSINTTPVFHPMSTSADN
ncbi:hypothetical protein F7D09_1706 [Bifidobacterium leontopitheci]|uniref:Uncharacterized protein n=1 Tax=Bifidobacterium leontopitheci TaxID=2650774 RepID=A0A6I1GJL9_9BIFI|nr:hypothetical protein F7D09_1706 [Bifidobacterium leontopitheci]